MINIIIVIVIIFVIIVLMMNVIIVKWRFFCLRLHGFNAFSLFNPTFEFFIYVYERMSRCV